MTGYQSKRAAARDKLNDDDDTQVYGDALNEDAIIIQYHEATIKRLEKRIEELMAQPAQELWAGVDFDIKLTPPQRPWVGLDEKDFSAINQSCFTKLQAATSAESILKEKNNG